VAAIKGGYQRQDSRGAAVEEASALGAALLAGVATGVTLLMKKQLKQRLKLRQPIGRGRKYIRNTTAA